MIHCSDQRQERNDPCTLPAKLETFSEKISALTGTGKEMMIMAMTRNREIRYERILAWTTEGAYEVFGNMYRQISARRHIASVF